MLNQEFDELTLATSEKKIFYKNMSIKAGIFCGILAVFFGLLVTFSLLGRKSWRSGLKHEIERVFSENSYSEYSVGEYVRLDSAMNVNCAVFNAESEVKKDFESYAVIIRFPTLYGPVAAVYVHESKKTEATFIGFAQINSRLSDSIKSATMNSQVAYWATKIPSITATAVSASATKAKGDRK